MYIYDFSQFSSKTIYCNWDENSRKEISTLTAKSFIVTIFLCFHMFEFRVIYKPSYK